MGECYAKVSCGHARSSLYFIMLINTLVNVLFPPICLKCRTRVGQGVLCKSCFEHIAVRGSFLCGECHAPLPVAYDYGWNNADDGDGGSKELCHPSFPYVLGAAADYADQTVQTLVHHLKFRSIKGAAEPLAKLILCHLGKVDFHATNFIVIPIPLTPRRLRSRGYNQADSIASFVAAKLDLPLVTNTLTRAKYAKPQTETSSAAERRINIRGAYAIHGSAAAHVAIRGANILLIDDVSTSGATFLEASLTLKAAGAAKIIAIAAAKT